MILGTICSELFFLRKKEMLITAKTHIFKKSKLITCLYYILNVGSLQLL